MRVQDYATKIAAWQQSMEAEIRVEDGWLSVIGLLWLQAGENTFGSDAGNDIILPADRSPAHAGTFWLVDDTVTVQLAENVIATADGQPISGKLELQSDLSGSATIIALNSLLLHIIRRGERYALRLRDKESAALKNFSGRQWFPTQESYRVIGAFSPHPSPKTLQIVNTIGDTIPISSPGFVTFTLQGQTFSLDAHSERDGQPFFIIKDATSGQTTYPAGRFLAAKWLDERQIIIDFNQAVSPPCAFTDYATCPLPPPQNHLPLKIEAGEKYVAIHH